MTSSQWSTSIAVGPMIMWTLLLTVKHVVADFLPVKTWLAAGTVGAGGRLEPLTVHCLIHGVLATLLFVLLAPKLWFLGIVDFAVRMIIDRTTELYGSRLEKRFGPQWFWWLIGIDKALYHLTDFALALIVVSNI
jgi:hypothetical protein